MNTGADVRSLEALQDWYSALVEFRSDGQNAMTALGMALQNAHHWLDEQHDYWQRGIRRAEEHVSRARIELRNREFQSFSDGKADTTVQEEDLRRAKAELDLAEERFAAVRRWKLKLPVAIQDIYQGPARNLEFFLEVSLAQGLARLDRHLTALEEYLGVKPLQRALTPVRQDSQPGPPESASKDQP